MKWSGLLRVTYDISVLGAGMTNQRARTGVFRVVEELALQLAARSELELEFASLSGLASCLQYLERSRELQQVPLHHYKPLLHLESLKNRCSERSKQHRFPIKHALKGVREILKGSHKLLELVYAAPGRSRLNGCQIYHSPFLPLPAKPKAPLQFITIYDLIPIMFPRYFEYKEDHLLNRIMQSITKDTWVFCISAATRNDLLSINPRVDPDKVAVIPLGASPLFYPCRDRQVMRQAREKYGIPDRPYFLSVSTLEPRKNIDATIRAFARMVQQENLSDVNLVLVGTKGWDFGRIFDQIAECKGLEDRILVTGFVDDQDLAPLYSGALAFVYPSYYEGFGLPPLEAMQCGTAVIASNTSSLPEVVGDAGIQVAPDDNDALSQAMLDLLQDSELRGELATRSRQRAALFSWEACADTTLEHYRRALNQTGSVTLPSL
jgi:glycosyltransferase involved in cell wall biosynthesis